MQRLIAISLAVLALVVLLTGGWVLHHYGSTIDLSGDGCLVFAYHRIIPRQWLLGDLRNWLSFDLSGRLDDYTLHSDTFLEQIRSLKALGAHFIAPQQLESIVRRQSKPPEKCVLMTLDDGDISQYRFAFPILKQEQIPFALFVISGQVGARNFNGLEMATWPQIREMIQSGLATVGSHTNNLHLQDSSGQPLFLRPENAGRFADDLRSSLLTIEQQAGVTPRYFAYPYGFGTPQTDEAALRLGMRLLFSLRPGVVHPGDPSFYVKRVMVTSRNWDAIARWAAQTPPT